MTTMLLHELRRLMVRPRTWIGFGAFLLLESLLFFLMQTPKASKAFSHLLESNGLDGSRYARGLTLAFVGVVVTFSLVGALYVTLVAGDIVAKETEEGTMRLILARPVSRERMLLVKIFASTIHTTLLVGFLAATSLILGRVTSGAWGGLFIFMPEERVAAFHDAPQAWHLLWIAFCLLALNAQLMSALAFFFSCFDMKAAAATILALSCLLIDFVLSQMPWFESFQAYFITWHFRSWMRVLWDPTPWPLIWRSEILLIGLTLMFYWMGVVRFCTRDLKS